MQAVDRCGQIFLRRLFLRMKASHPYVSKALHGEINITFATAVRFARALQLDFFPQLVQLATDEFNEPALLDFSLGSGSPCCRAIKRTKVVWNVLATSLSNGTPLRVR